MKSECNIQNSGRVTASKEGATLFRNNVGGAWAGRKVKSYTDKGKRYTVLENPSWITFGLFKGSADTVGWKTITITPDMMGQTFAQFLSVEFKTKTGKPSKEQLNWHDIVCKAGGLSGVARSDDDVRRIIGGDM